MSVELVFKGDISLALVVDSLQPPGGGHNISVSGDSPGINRHDVTIISSGKETIVRIDGPGKSEMSSNTLNSIIDAVPSEHILTRDV